MTILCIFLLCFSLITLCLFQIVMDKSQSLLVELNHTLDTNSILLEKNERFKTEVERLIKGINTRDDNIKELRKENQDLINTNLNNQDQIDSLSDQLRGYKDGDFLNSDELECIHDDIHLNVGNVNEKAQNLLISNKDLNLTVEDLNSIHSDLDLFVVFVEDAALSIISEVEEIKAQLFYLNSLL